MPWFYIFPTKHPLCRVPAGNGTGGGALDKVGRDCYHKSRKSAVTSGWLSVSANNYNADRLAPPRRSVCFYRTERALLLAVGSTRFAQIDYADRSVAAGRSARFYGPPCVGSRFGTVLLTKRGETAIIKAERALLLVVSFAVLHHIIMNNADRLAGTQAASLSESCTSKFYADRLAATERSARFYGQVYKTPCVGSRSGTAQGVCSWGQVVWWAGSSR